MLEPRELTVPDSISAKTLEDMDRAIQNFNMGKVSETIDLSDFQKGILWHLIYEWELPIQ